MLIMRSFLLLSITILFSIQLFAQEADVDTVDIEQVFIRSSRAGASDPVTIQNIPMEQIEAIYSGQDPAVLLQQLSPSIVSYSDAGTDIGNYAQFRIRGISQSRINVTLNGVPLNDMLDQGVFFSNFSDFGNSIESIQVQRGVGASNVGVASYGGAINFESANIFQSKPKSQFQLTTGSFGTLRGSGEFNSGLMKNNVGVYGRITRTSVDGYKTHSASDSYSAFGSIGYIGEKDVLKFTGFMGKTQNDQSYLPVLLSDIQADPKTNYNHPNDTDDFEQELFQLQYARNLEGGAKLDATLYYGGARGIFPFAIDNETQFVFGLSNDHYGLMSHLSYDIGNVSFKSGIQAYRFNRENFEYIAPNVQNPYDRDQSNKTEFSAFGKVNYQLNKTSLFGNIQLRNSSINLEKDPELGTGIEFSDSWFFANFIAGFRHHMNQQQSVYASFGRSGREPTRSDIRNGVTQAEYANDIEFGWNLKTDAWKIHANLFHMKFENEISQVGALQELSYMEIRQNVADSRRSGIELEMAYQPNTKTRLKLNGALMTTNVSAFDNGGQILTDVEHIFAPKYIFRPQLDYNFSDNLGVILSGRFVGESFMELANLEDFELPAHSVFNIQGNIKITKNAKFSVMLNNIFDELYFTDGAPVDLDFDGNVEGPGYRVQPPRHVYVIFTLGF